MATTNLKRITANAIVDYLSTNIVGLTGKVFATAADPEITLPCLALRVISTQPIMFEPTDSDEVYEAVADDGKVIVDVGQFTGRFTLELYTTSPAERELYEQAIIDLFLNTEWAHGTLYLTTPTLTVNSYVSLYSAELKVRLESEQWIEEMSFEAKRYSFMDVSIDYPALTTRDAHTIDSLQIWLSDADGDALIVEAE